MLSSQRSHSTSKRLDDSIDEVRASPTSELVHDQVDVVVVGAGFAGLSAARSLVEAGLSVMVIEARDRVGGRSYSVKQPTYFVDRGAGYIDSTQTEIVKLCSELGLTRYKVYDQGKNIQFLNDRRTEYTGSIPPLGVAALIDAHLALQKLNKLAATIDVEKPWQSPNAIEYDSMTVDTFYRNHVFWTADAQRFISIGVSSLFCSEINTVSALASLYYAKSGHNLEHQLSITGGAQEEKIKGGTQQLCDGLAKIVEKSGGKLIFSTPIDRVVHDESSVTLIARNGNKYKAKRCIITIPLPLCGRLHYDPPMPVMRDQLTQRVFMGSIIKTHCYYKTSFWREKGYSGQFISDQGPICVTVDDCDPDGKYFALVGFLLARHYTEWESKTTDQRRDAITMQYAKCFNDDQFLTPVAYDEHNWNTEEFSRGCYGALFTPGVLTQCGPALRAPVGTIHWAGTDIAPEFSGYMEGAMRSGQRAAKEVIDELLVESQSERKSIKQ